jgi:hypothetical protein
LELGNFPEKLKFPKVKRLTKLRISNPAGKSGRGTKKRPPEGPLLSYRFTFKPAQETALIG